MASAATRPAPRGLSKLEWAGIGTAGAGVVSLGVGGYFLGKALSKNADSEDDCNSQNRCGSAGTSDRDAALDAGNWATAFGIGGGVLLLAGGSLFLVGRSERNERPTLSVSVQANGVRVSGAF
jgi:hypothetical protein